MLNFKLIILIVCTTASQPLWGMLEKVDNAINKDAFVGDCYLEYISDCHLEKYIQDPKTDLLATNKCGQTILDILEKRCERTNLADGIIYLVALIKKRLHQEIWSTFYAENYERLKKLISNSDTDVHSINQRNQTIREAIEERISQNESLHSILDPIIKLIGVREQNEIK